MKAKHNLRKLKILNDAVDLAVEVYTITAKFPKDERFGLVSQMNRSAVSIASNIAEGAGRNTAGEFIQFLGIAIGSGNELFTQTVISNRLKIIDNEIFNKIKDKVYKIQQSIFNFSRTLEDQKHIK